MFVQKKLNNSITKLNENIEKANLKEIAYVLGNKKQILLRNFIAGISRGVGIGIGVTLITAIIVLILRNIVKLNIPVIGKIVADIVEIVEETKY